MVYLTRRECFNAAHKLWVQDWDEAKNIEVFGKCANHNWHGHNYEMFVTLKGEIDPKTGFFVNLKELSRIIKDTIVEKIDHKNLNLDVDFMNGVIPTVENLAIKIFEILKKELAHLPCELHCVKIGETENNFVEYYG